MEGALVEVMLKVASRCGLGCDDRFGLDHSVLRTQQRKEGRKSAVHAIRAYQISERWQQKQAVLKGYATQ